MNVVIALCLVCMLAIVVGVIVRLFLLNREEKLKFLKGFKKGQFALIYMVAIPMYWMGIAYSGASIWESLLRSVKATIELVVLSYNYSMVSALMADNVFYRAVMDICFVLVTLNAILFAVTIFHRKMFNFAEKVKMTKGSKKVFVVVGYNEHNVDIIKSADEKTDVVLLSESTDEILDFCYAQKVAHIKFEKGDDLDKTLIKTFKDFTKKQINVIINTEDESQNLIYVQQVSKTIEEMKLSDFVIDEKRGVNVYVFGEPENMTSYLQYVELTKGCVHYINKYKLIARDFVSNYPLTRYMTEEQIDYDSATIRSDVNMNVVMIGFGKTSQQVFLTSVANNQFLTKKDGKLVQKDVNYYVYDKRDAENDKNLNHTYFRYENEVLDRADKSKYLPLPPKPANVVFRQKLDVNDAGFYESVKRDIDVEGAFNYVIIAFGSDMANLDMAEKIVAKLKEWGLYDKTKVFVKIRSDKLSNGIKDTITTFKEAKLKEEFITFGIERNLVYNLSQIVDENQEMMARDKHMTYQLEDAKYKKVDIAKDRQAVKDGKMTLLDYIKKWYEADKEKAAAMVAAINSSEAEKPTDGRLFVGDTKYEYEEDVKRDALKSWYAQSQIQRDNNVYVCMCIREKLNLLGYDYIPRTNDEKDACAEYEKKYEEGDPIVYGKERDGIKGKLPVKYTIDFVNGSKRQAMAILEHQRWNAYMISNGVIPSTIEQIENGDSKNLALRRHGNVTTFEGLVEFRKIMAKKDNCSEEKTDVIKYDYQIMDDLVWLLNQNGYMIVKRKSEKEIEAEKKGAESQNAENQNADAKNAENKGESAGKKKKTHKRKA